MSTDSTRNSVTRIRAGALALLSLLTFAGAASAVVVNLQEGVSAYAGTRDASILGDNRGAAPSSPNNTAELDIWERETSLNNDSRVLIGFDLGSIAPGTPAYAASLTLTLKAYAFGTHPTLTSLYLVNAADKTWTEAQATWNNLNQSTPTAWAGGPGLVSGTDFNATAIATVSTPAANWTNGTTLTFTFNAAGLTALSDWILNPGNNSGFFISQGIGNPGPALDSFVQLYSSEDATTSFHPLLSVLIPEPTSLGVLAVGASLLLKRRRA